MLQDPDPDVTRYYRITIQLADLSGERSTEAMTDGLLKAMAYLGIDVHGEIKLVKVDENDQPLKPLQGPKICPECGEKAGNHADNCYHANCDSDDWPVHGCGPVF